MARPAKPMTPALNDCADDCADGAMSLDDGAEFLAICRRELDRIINRGELEVVYYGRKPRVLKAQLKRRLARELEETREAVRDR